MCSTHRGERILAFASYAATVHSLFEQLGRDGEVAAATARGGRIASGGVSREEVLRMFRAPKHRRERLRLLLATDLLSEGLNLPEASVVVHLDLPWTAARLEQRLGRARRPGNSSREVRCYAFTQPQEIERLIGKEQLIARKASAAEDIVGQLALGDTDTARKVSPPRAMESVRRTLSQWKRSGRIPAPDGRIRVAAVRAPRAGFLALIRTRHGGVLIAGQVGDVANGPARSLSGDVGTVPATTDPNVVHATVAMAGSAASPIVTRSYLAVRRTIARWLADESVRRATGTPSILPRELRALVQRLDAAVASAPLHLRSGVAVRVERLREALLSRLPRGMEVILAARARSVADDMQLITTLQTLIANARGTPVPAEDELAVILILESNVQRIRSAMITSADRRP